jgi:curved DNA-binding protein CbpA
MPKRDLYRILGISAQAAADEIKRAYRRLAFILHPDVGSLPNAERFHEVHDAYEVLSNPERRRSYDVEISTRPHPSAAEPLQTKAPVRLFDDFLAVRPSPLEEFIDSLERSVFGYPGSSGGRTRRLRLEAILDVQEARLGCRIPLSTPVER